ncbi:RNA polymerase sigma factor [Elongatibacter sediminis]|uniref:Sigma-70 family RNA polymerase sigma factor n=1 Tax=Elongatibacter sediminis TaxID=3119006 RepID=A0AAW9RHB1_9GAMM
MSGSAFDITLDDVTLARARRGDEAARERIFRLYHQPVYAIAYRVCQCPELAQDVTQEAFINALERLRQFRGDSPFWGWLRRVVVNHAISALRRAPKHDAIELEEYHAAAPGDAGRVELGLDLADALSRLDPEDRAVVWLYDVEGYNHAEIAGFFGLTASFSKTRLSRARARLRELMGPGMNPRDTSTDQPASEPTERDHDREQATSGKSPYPAGVPAGGC